MKIAGRTFVISGGASGLGRACAADLVVHGGNVAVLDLNAESGAEAVAELTPERARFFAADVTDTDSIAAAVEGAADWARRTGRPIGGVIPAAGTGLPGLMLDGARRPLPLSSLDLVLAVNLRGTLDLVRQVLPHIAAAPPEQGAEGADGERGVVVMVSSAAAFDGQMGQVAYAASKGALAAVALPMARDLSRFGIRVGVVAPSVFETAMTAQLSEKVRKGLEKAMEFPKRGGRPEEFAMLVRQIVENPMLNGVVVRLDGGTRMPSRL